MTQQSRRADPQTGGHNDAGTSPLQTTIVKPEQALSIKPFGLDVKVLLSTEATGGAISVLVGRIKPGEGPGGHVHFNQEDILHRLSPIIVWKLSVETSSSLANGCGCVPSALRSS